MRSGTDIGAMNNKSAVVALVEVTLIVVFPAGVTVVLLLTVYANWV